MHSQCLFLENLGERLNSIKSHDDHRSPHHTTHNLTSHFSKINRVSGLIFFQYQFQDRYQAISNQRSQSVIIASKSSWRNTYFHGFAIIGHINLNLLSLFSLNQLENENIDNMEFSFSINMTKL